MASGQKHRDGLLEQVLFAFINSPFPATLVTIVAICRHAPNTPMKQLPVTAYGRGHGWGCSVLFAAVHSAHMVLILFRPFSTGAIIGICHGVIGKLHQENRIKTFFFKK